MLRIVERAQQVRDRTRTLVKLNIELAQLELKRKARLYGIAVALGVIALMLVLYAIGFLFAAIATGIAESLPLWAALLIVTLLLALTAGALVFVAARLIKKAGPPKPAAAIEEAQTTAQELLDG
jgi:H+/Cl- antiporter ClcA